MSCSKVIGPDSLPREMTAWVATVANDTKAKAWANRRHNIGGTVWAGGERDERQAGTHVAEAARIDRIVTDRLPWFNHILSSMLMFGDGLQSDRALPNA